jgi:hypothetical protein
MLSVNDYICYSAGRESTEHGFPFSDYDTDHSIQAFDVEIKISKAGSNLDPS